MDAMEQMSVVHPRGSETVGPGGIFIQRQRAQERDGVLISEEGSRPAGVSAEQHLLVGTIHPDDAEIAACSVVG
jgi:hypothetical protein